MMYCTKCGSDLKGSKGKCPVCGYSMSKMNDDLYNSSRGRAPVREVSKRVSFAPSYPQPDRAPSRWESNTDVEVVDAKKVTDIEDEEDLDPTLVDGCSVCGRTPQRRCTFCLEAICDSHTEKMTIYVRTMPFGGSLVSCPRCAREREGRSPTRAEADEAGMFFSIKPYHEWHRVKK